MKIRPETPADYAAVGRLNALAFQRRAEAVIVTLHRERAEYDAELSLVAEIDGEIVGHALFSPRSLRVTGHDLKIVNLAPLAVAPAYQKQGIGTALMKEGHSVARRKGYVLSMLLGHTSYYPRLGYRTNAFGNSTLTVATASLPPCTLTTRPPQEADIPELVALWRYEEEAVDMSIVPGNALLDWLSPNPAVETRVYLRNDQMVGYSRGPAGCPLQFLARDDGSAQEMASYLGQGSTSIQLPLHPQSASAGAFNERPICNAWEAAMVLPLIDSPFGHYMGEVKDGVRVVGRPIWPVEFDVE